MMIRLSQGDWQLDTRDSSFELRDLRTGLVIRNESHTLPQGQIPPDYRRLHDLISVLDHYFRTIGQTIGRP